MDYAALSARIDAFGVVTPVPAFTYEVYDLDRERWYPVEQVTAAGDFAAGAVPPDAYSPLGAGTVDPAGLRTDRIRKTFSPHANYTIDEIRVYARTALDQDIRTQEWGTNPDRQQANTKDEDPTGLLNERYRYRDLETGTFLSRDPAGFIDGPNLYTYVVQNPWTKYDPLGLHANDEVAEIMETFNKEAAAEMRSDANRLEQTGNELFTGIKTGVEIAGMATGADTISELSGETLTGEKTGSVDKAMAAASVTPLGKLKKFLGVIGDVVKGKKRTDKMSDAGGMTARRQRAEELSKDVEQGKPIMKQGIGGQRIEEQFGLKLSPSTEKGADFIAEGVGPISLKGPLLKADGSSVEITPQMVQGLADSVVKDVRQNTFAKEVFVDTLNMSVEQKAFLTDQILQGVAGAERKPVKFIK